MRREQAMDALLRVIADNCEAGCRAARERSAGEARTALRSAHAEARKRVRPTVEEASRRPRDRLARARAQRRTRERIAHQRRVRARLERAWSLLRESLARSWLDAEGRRGWVERAAARAAETLRPGEWRVAHPADWPAEEIERLRRALADRGVVEAIFAPDALVRAGVRLASGHTVLDATLEGLLADRAAVEARLLFHLAESA